MFSVLLLLFFFNQCSDAQYDLLILLKIKTLTTGIVNKIYFLFLFFNKCICILMYLNTQVYDFCLRKVFWLWGYHSTVFYYYGVQYV